MKTKIIPFIKSVVLRRSCQVVLQDFGFCHLVVVVVVVVAAVVGFRNIC